MAPKKAPPPQDPETLLAEKSVLAGILCALPGEEGATRELVSTLQPDDFQHPPHRAIFRAIVHVAADKNAPIDLVTVDAALRCLDVYDMAGGPAWSRVTNDSGMLSMAVYHAKQILSASRKRRARLHLQSLTEQLGNGISTEDASEALREIQRMLTSGSSAIATRTMRDLLETDFPAREYILTPWLRAKDLAMVYSPAGRGKTLFCLNVALSVAGGLPCFKWQCVQPRRVLYVDGEMAREEMRERSVNMLRGMADNTESLQTIADNCTMIMSDDQDRPMQSLGTTTGQSIIDRQVEKLRPDLLILDNISTLANTDVEENSAESWAPVQSWLVDLRRRGVAVLLVHHAGKGGGQRGTSKRSDALNTVINLATPEDYRMEDGCRFVLKFEKSRGLKGVDLKPFDARLCSDSTGWTWTIRDCDDAEDDLIRQMISDGVTVREIAKVLHVGTHRIMRIKGARA